MKTSDKVTYAVIGLAAIGFVAIVAWKLSHYTAEAKTPTPPTQTTMQPQQPGCPF